MALSGQEMEGEGGGTHKTRRKEGKKDAFLLPRITKKSRSVVADITKQ